MVMWKFYIIYLKSSSNRYILVYLFMAMMCITKCIPSNVIHRLFDSIVIVVIFLIVVIFYFIL